MKKPHGNLGRKNPHGKVAYSQLSKQEQLAYMREVNKRSYAKRVGGLKRNMNHTPESRAQWARDKANRRCTRAKQARFTDELTQLVVIEAHILRKLRNNITGFEWHVDHIEPLRGKDICGLHIWSNIQVIPKRLNLIKGSNRAFHAQWEEGLQEGESPVQLETGTTEKSQ
jgi:hypothetical protein